MFIFKTKNEKILEKHKKQLKQIHVFQSLYTNKNDSEIKEDFFNEKKRLLEIKKSLHKKNKDEETEIVLKIFSIIREMSKRILNKEHFDVQLLAGLLLNNSYIVEMKTGEGKTLVATTAAILNSFFGQVHVVTTNDYLARRDLEELKPLYDFFEIKTAFNGSNLTKQMKKEVYLADILYGTNSEFCFDYLRDTLKLKKEDCVQKDLYYVIIDEVDSILIDEARSPLIVSGSKSNNKELTLKCNELVEKLDTKYFKINLENNSIEFEEEIFSIIEKHFNINNLFEQENTIIYHYMEQALKAHYLFEKDRQYIVLNNEIVIVDEHNGRLAKGKKYSSGLHQAIEAKENLEISDENKTLAETTYQNYFKSYKKMCGMTGTAKNEEVEFHQIYNLEVVVLPTKEKVKRKDYEDLVFMNEDDKINAIIKKTKELFDKKQPILIGTTSIEKSEFLSEQFKKNNIPHKVINAKRHEEEGDIVSKAGEIGNITIATNMAGRGVDIKISKEVEAIGGLYVIGTERHESRRIDDQLRGRSGRQGDAGETQFYLSLDDPLLKNFGGDKLKKVMSKIGIKKGDIVSSKMVTNVIEKTQKKIENIYFEQRKNLLNYDDVVNAQREIIQKNRKKILFEEINIIEKNKEFLNFYIELLFKKENITQVNIEEEDFLKIKDHILKDFGLIIEFKEFPTIQELKSYLIKNLNNFKDNNISDLNMNVKEIYTQLYLQILDSHWVEHIELLNSIKEGTKLRSYNQKDPLTEFKKEAYHLFELLLETIKTKYITTIYRLKFNDVKQNLNNQKINLDEAEKFLKKLKK